ncbi:hypothetical protein POTOM_031241 [Populus tomentosa]|uniref:Pollen Ole e 1 allergen and extensin family protein n=1 Tax=Populus tomentosa TaxID=118781 RepID=A0A8X7Z7D8_POPTO|nr:hypothetical protein POTOM_031241 [Populus tomentosa]
MASNQLTIVVCSLLLLPLAFLSTAAHDETTPTKPVEKKVDVVVEGMVYCQSCKYSGSWSLTGAEPIPSAKVGVICKNFKKQVTYYKAYETNAYGYFYAQLDDFKMSNNILDHPLHGCHVKLISSSLANCSLLSNVNYGLYGAPLRFENKVLRGSHYEAVIYAAGPLAFRPAQCTPETHV